MPLNHRYLWMAARLEEFNVPEVEDKSKTMARITQPISIQQVSAWGPMFSNTNNNKSGSRMRNLPTRKPRQVRKIVELSFDPEWTEDFPHLQTAKPDKASNSVTYKVKLTSSSHTSVSGVTKAGFLTLGEDFRALVMNEVQSHTTAQTKVTMITLMREEMIANRREANEQMMLLNTRATEQNNRANEQMLANRKKLPNKCK